MRGRVPAGLTDGGMLGLTMDPAVNPASSLLNPNYSLETKYGNNYVTLGINEMPRHTHTNTAVSTDTGHTHLFPNPATNIYNAPFGVGFGAKGGTEKYLGDNTSIPLGYANIETTVTINENGFNGAHTNTQPTIGCYYIMYIPV
jgi:microcystin-dependent protein